jgi:hypothetical protein
MCTILIVKVPKINFSLKVTKFCPTTSPETTHHIINYRVLLVRGEEMESPITASHESRQTPTAEHRRSRMRITSPCYTAVGPALDEDDVLLRQAEDSTHYLRGEGDCTVDEAQSFSVHPSRLFEAGEEKNQSPPHVQPKKSRRIKDQRWQREAVALARQKWSHAQSKAIKRSMARLQLTTGTHSAIVFIPETFNASTFATTGPYPEFIRAWSAGLAEVRARNDTKLQCSVTELVSRFDNTSELSHTAVFDKLFSICHDILPADLLQEARRILDIEIASVSTTAQFRPDQTRLSKALCAALESYVKT